MDIRSTCKYCIADSAPSGMLLVTALAGGNVFLLDDPKYPGRCVVSSKWHVRELFDLTPEQRITFLELVNAVAKAVAVVTISDKVNIAFYGDQSDHLHAHVVPKWLAGNEWGGAFVLQPSPTEPHQCLGALAGKSMPEMASYLGKQLQSTP